LVREPHKQNGIGCLSACRIVVELDDILRGTAIIGVDVPVDDPIIRLILGVPTRKGAGFQSAIGANLLEDGILDPDRVIRVHEAPDRVNVLGRAQGRAEDEGVLVSAPGERILPKLSIQDVGSLVAEQAVASSIAGDPIVAVTSFRILDEGACIAPVLERIEDIASGKATIPQVRTLYVGDLAPTPRPEIDAQVRRVVGEVVGVGAAAIPDRLEDTVVAGRALPDAIDERLACCRAPRVDRITLVGAEIRSVQMLKRIDVIDHGPLCMIPELVPVPGACRRTDIRAVAHDREFHAIPIQRERIEGAADLVRVLEPDSVADLMQNSGERITASDSEAVQATAELGVSGERVRRGEVGVSRRIARIGETHVADDGSVIGHFAE
jgi:hypothetical protein